MATMTDDEIQSRDEYQLAVTHIFREMLARGKAQGWLTKSGQTSTAKGHRAALEFFFGAVIGVETQHPELARRLTTFAFILTVRDPIVEARMWLAQHDKGVI